MIEATHLSFRYNAETVIQFPEIRITPGQHTLLLGESGSGKTTLLHILGGLLRKYEGNVVVAGTHLNTLSESSLDAFRGKHIGFIFQRNHLINALTVRKNLLLSPYLNGKSVSNERVDEVLTSLGLFQKQHSRISQLSQGQAQRVAIARAVVHQPPLILADEPTSALDDANCHRVIQLLLQAATSNQATLVIATHDQRLKSIISNQINLTH